VPHPEFQSTGVAMQKSNVYAFGVVILELLSGEEPFKYKYDKAKGEFVRSTVIEAARVAIEGDGLIRWEDRKLKYLFPVEVAGKLTRLALDCVHVEADMRPNIGHVAGKISKQYLETPGAARRRRRAAAVTGVAGVFGDPYDL